MFSLFSKLKHRRPHNAMVFIDYEYWYHSYKKQYHLIPNLSDFRKTLTNKNEFLISDIMVFADFSNENLKNELPNIRKATNTIIETGNTYFGIKKDLTDFVMLDYIYQCSISRKDIDTYVIFTGDGHFQSVTRYLVQQRALRVILYAVQGSLSKQLKAVATETTELPTSDKIQRQCRKLIIDNLEYVSTRPSIIPTFLSTVNTVSERYNVPSEVVHATLSSMIDDGYIYQKIYRVEFNRNIKIVAANWEKLRENGLYPLD